MSDVIVIDAVQLRDAAPRVAELYATLLQSGKALSGLGTGGCPGALAARVHSVVSAASGKITAAANMLEGTAEELLRRAGLADLADKLSTLGMATSAPGLTAALIAAAQEAGTYGVPARVGAVAGAGGWALGSLGLTLSVGVPTAHDLANPYLDDDRRIANAAARGITAGGMLIAGGMIIGASGGVLAPVVLVAGAGLAFSILDRKLGITNGIADGIDWATDQTSAAVDTIDDGIDAAGDVIDDGLDAAGDVIDDISPF